MKHRSLSLQLIVALISIFYSAIAQDNNKVKPFDLSSGQYRVTDLSFNSSNSDFGLFPSGPNNFFFSSNRTNEKGTNEKQSYNWNNLPFLDIYMVVKSGDTSFTPPVALPGDAESKFNEGPVFFDATSNTFFITRNHYNKSRNQQSRNGVNRLKVYIENIDGTSFKSFGEFQHNSNSFSVGHAALSSDGQRIYFSSDMPGGFGGVDLFVSIREGDKWGVPKNLGPAVNTAGNEMFPFLSADGKLYFSSNGHAAQVGLDIYSAEIVGEEYKNVKNLGKPFNSDQDDFSFYIYPDNKSGYLSSNRTGGKGDDDIYSFELSNPVIDGLVVGEKDGAPVPFAKIKIVDDELKVTELAADSSGQFSFTGMWINEYTLEARKEGFTNMTRSVFTSKEKSKFAVQFSLVKEEYGLEGLVLNKDKNTPIAGVMVSLRNKTTGKIYTVNADDKGFFHFNVSKDNEYVINVEKEKFLTAYVPISTKNMGIGVRKQNVLLEELVVGKSIKVDNVYYDLGKWDIRSDAKSELDKLVELMTENPSMQIELSSHTDSRGSDASNLSLSDKRAKAVASYVISKGIAASRVTGKGYGESKLLNACGNAKKCSDGEHQMNRRTEFKILKI